MLGQMLILGTELLLIVAGVVPNIVLILVTLWQQNRDVDLGMILLVAILDLVCSCSLLTESVGNLAASAFQIEILPDHLADIHAALVLLPATMVGLGLAGILSVIRCMGIVYGKRVGNWILYVAVFLLSLLVLGFNLISYSNNGHFFSEVMLLSTTDPTRVWDWYICFTLLVFSFSLVAIVVSYGLIAHHYLFLKRICELGVELHGTIWGLVSVLLMYSLVIAPRIAMTVIRQFHPGTNYPHSGITTLSLFTILPLINAAFSLLPHDETRHKAMLFLCPNKSRLSMNVLQ